VGLALTAPALERTTGGRRLALHVFVGGVLAMSLAALTNGDRTRLVAGASGAVMAVVGGLVGAWLADRAAPDARKAATDAILIFVLQAAFDRCLPGAAWDVHLAGFLVGAPLGWISAYQARRKNPTRRRTSAETP
jgi:membrane associated rhomboid family serine protease